ncbi:hypothetical protein [Chryseobacterium cucumeris]|uniref:hypothetical protein n=1 Tax=Chryseobacterium cucumeris TaxID=1813611 RepID=UPI00245865D7|nr:hypothetical protein [Chryseobacterium cucumeris]MDH5033782.1 hypothetical protein [Chryseobacterium cucumeris]
MRINNSSDFDLDLFFKSELFLMHFATAGLQISDENFFENNHSDFRYFLKNLSVPPFKYELNPNLREILSFKREIDKEFNIELYTIDFISYAQKGMFSFDRTFIENSTDINFHLVAYPILDENYNNFLYHFFKIKNYVDYDYINKSITEIVNRFFRNSFNLKF